MYFDPIHYDSLYTPVLKLRSSEPAPSSIVHAEQADCIVRSDNPLKGSLYIGNLQASESGQLLKDLHIGSLLTCARGYAMTDEFQNDSSLYKYLPLEEQTTYGIQMGSSLSDTMQGNPKHGEILKQIQDLFVQGANFIQESLKHSNVLVHCVSGASRSIAVVAAYLIKSQRMNDKQAVSFIKSKRNTIFNLGRIFQSALKEFSLDKIVFGRERTQALSQAQSNYKHEKSLQSSRSQQRQPATTSRGQIDSNIIVNKSPYLTPSNQPLSHVPSVHLNGSRQVTRSRITEKNSHKRSASVEQSRVSERNGNSKVSGSMHSSQRGQEIGNNYSQIRHKEPKYFEKILSSNHKPECIGVKRQLKNSVISAKKQMNMSSTCLDRNLQQSGSVSMVRDSRNKTNSKLDNVSQASSKSMGSRRRNQDEEASSNMGSSRAKSAMSSRVSDSRISGRGDYSNNFGYNPECGQMQGIGQSRLSPSKKLHFKDVNQQLNFDIGSILKEYESATKKVRNTYHQRLRGVKVGPNNI